MSTTDTHAESDEPITAAEMYEEYTEEIDYYARRDDAVGDLARVIRRLAGDQHE